MNLEILDDYSHLEGEEPVYSTITKGKRIVGVVLEYIFLIVLMLPFSILGMEDFSMFFMFFVFLNKDIIGGKSPVKRMMQTKLIHIETKEAPTPLRLSFRSWTVMFGIFEFLAIALRSDHRRIGDLITKTEVVDDSNPHYQTSFKEDWQNTNWKNVFICLGFYIGFSALGFFLSLGFH